jgi:hypothetical protein
MYVQNCTEPGFRKDYLEASQREEKEYPMFRRQGKYLDPNELDRIISLLRESELTLSEIATRMSCSRGAIASVNRRFRVREYKGLRARWVMN